MIRVRLFAALRDAAGTSHLTSEATTLADLRSELAARFGEPFASRLAISTAAIDGTPVPKGAQADLPDGCEVALLPPFSGG